MSNVDTVAMALGPWRERGGPLFACLAAALAEAAHRGTLPASGELPAERALAEALGVSRGTVVSAYRELRDRGLAETRHGSGTVIRAGLPPGASWPALSDLLGAVGSSPQMIDLSLGVPPLADVADLLEVNARSLASNVDWHGYAPLGLNALREEVAALLTRRGAATSAEEVLITGGAQEAIALAVGLLASDGRRIAVESPGYAGALDAIARVKGVAVPIARDAAGIRTDDLKQQLERRHVHALFVTPGVNLPTGTATASARRERLVALARHHDFMIVEDTVLDELRYDADPGVPLWTLAPERVLMAGSLSKFVWGGLRVGWLRAPRALVLRLGRVKGALNLGVGALDQRAALDVVERYGEIAARRREQARVQMETMVAALGRELPEWTVERPAGGWSLWICLPAGSAAEFAQAALRHRVMISPGSPCSPDDSFPDYVRVCFGMPPSALEEGARRLAAAWRAFDPAAVPLSTMAGR